VSIDDDDDDDGNNNNNNKCMNVIDVFEYYLM
jgi:hypothetical protein